MGEFKEPYISWESRDSDRVSVWVAVDGRLSLAELHNYLREVAPDVALDAVMLNWATVRWTRAATPEELAERARRNVSHDARHAQWEREQYWRLKAKYEGVCVCGRALPCRHVDAEGHGPGSYYAEPTSL